MYNKELEALAFERLEQRYFLDCDVNHNVSKGTFTGFFMIDETISIDFTDSKFCLADEGEKIADISKELETAYEGYLNLYYAEKSNDDDLDYADFKNKFQREN